MTSMTDEELIAHLRLQGLDKDIAAANRIEELVKQQEEFGTDSFDRIMELSCKLTYTNAKLAKAVAALQFYAKEEWPQNYPCGVLYAAGNDTSEFKTHLDYGDKARAVLAELEEK